MPTSTRSGVQTPHWASALSTTPRFHAFAPRPLSYADPRSGSPLPPFARARRFLEHAAALSTAEWLQVIDRIGVPTETHAEEERRLRSMFVTPARQLARDSVVHQAVRLCSHLAHVERIPACSTGLLAQSLSSATLAVVLRDLLPPELFERVYMPYATYSERSVYAQVGSQRDDWQSGDRHSD